VDKGETVGRDTTFGIQWCVRTRPDALSNTTAEAVREPDIKVGCASADYQ